MAVVDRASIGLSRMTMANSDVPASGRQASVAQEFERQYVVYQYHVVEFLTEHLADLSRIFRGDLQQMLVLAIIGQVTLYARVGTGATSGARDISASRIADVTGIPRQTVRRKLVALEALGWIERTATASYQLVIKGEESPARSDLSEVDQRSIHRIARLFSNLEKLVPAERAARS